MRSSDDGSTSERAIAAPLASEPYPTWIVAGMDILAAGILVASFRDAWTVVRGLGTHGADDVVNSVVAAAVVLAIDASILLLEQARSHVKLRGGSTRYNDVWVAVLILISAILNVRYLTASGELLDRGIGAALGITIPSTIAVLGFLKGDMLAHNARCRRDWESANESPSPSGVVEDAPARPSDQPMFRITRPPRAVSTTQRTSRREGAVAVPDQVPA